MSVPSMVHRSGDNLIVRSVVSGDELYGDGVGAQEDQPPPLLCEKQLPDLPDCKVKRNYSCSTCDYFTKNPRHFLYHLRDVHDEKVRIYECPHCLYASKHFQKLLRHSRMVHGSEKTAELGGKMKVKHPPHHPVTAEEDDTSDNTTNSDNEEPEPMKQAVFKCSVCGFTAKSQVSLNKHEREEHIKTKFFRCAKCTYVTHMKARFTKHVKYHSMPMIKCDTCDFRTPYKWNLDRHCKNHNGKGAFRCSACNFTADIKQSLTVHEMNHHVPPVGQAAGFGIGRRRNKVGASDSAAAEDAALQNTQVIETNDEAAAARPSKTSSSGKSAKKAKITKSNNSDFDRAAPSPFGSDFINPDDIVHHANGNLYFKNKCKLCNFKTAWDGEMTKHEAKVHQIVKETQVKPTKKTPRPVPNLIPICKIASPPPMMSQKDFNEICAKSSNSALKDFASIMDDGENIFKQQQQQRVPPDLIPASFLTPPKNSTAFKRKNASFFDQLKEKLMNNDDVNLTCKFCGHRSNCLSEQVKHQKLCDGGETTNRTNAIRPNVFTSSSRCQHCRQRCKSSVDLLNHLQTCTKALKPAENSQHPMENRVFVWNNIEVPMDIDVDDSIYEYTDDRASDLYIHNEDKIEDNASLDLSIRTHSPESSEHSYNELVQQAPPAAPQKTSSPEKIPTHGTDISVAQHKRVFQCPHCTFWASTASRFHVHIVGHLNKKPFECSLCSYRSNWRWDITKHIKLKSVRDPAHESAKVLMTDETGRRNYTKYNKYLTEIHVSVDQSLDTSGGCGTRPKGGQSCGGGKSDGSVKTTAKMPPITADFNSVLKNTTAQQLKMSPTSKVSESSSTTSSTEKKKSSGETKRSLYQCKKCNFRDASRDVLLKHVKEHYTRETSSGGLEMKAGRSDVEKDERHCRLKHGGVIRVVSNKNGQEKLEIEEQTDEPDHIDVIQTGTFKCKSCPFSNENHAEFEEHLDGHVNPGENKCHYCNFNVSKREDLLSHLILHGVANPEDFLQRLTEREEAGKKFHCLVCPYVTNSKSQYTYHKQFHKPRGGQYSCTQCSYNVSKRHLLHQHLKVHGINVTPHRQNGDSIDMEEIADEIEEVPSNSSSSIDSQSFPDIPLVWVSKNDKFTKMYKCRYCPHVNLRKVNIQEHEKMHSVREKNVNAKGTNEIEHHCTECNYVCNNAGVLSSHSKVHQGLSGTVHCLVDPSKTDEEQISELTRIFNTPEGVSEHEFETSDNANDENPNQVLHFCAECPARFLKENEYLIHTRFHGVRLFYKCEYCSYTSRQKPDLLAHNQIHMTQYQERTKVLQSIYFTDSKYPQPQIHQITPNRSEAVWIVKHQEVEDVVKNVPKRSLNVPLSGTDLFQQKYEAEQSFAKAKPIQKTDAQFGSSINGNPNFIYPTTLKNGKMKEKRYKCPKCPSAFEKREQYKIHLGLHGSKQRYKCETCDYSVKYHANYLQHLKKHVKNEMAQAEKNNLATEDESEDTEMPYSEELDNIEALNETIELSIENQSCCSTIKEHLTDEKKLFHCHLCPYANYRKDAVENHLKRHTSHSGIVNNHTCEICDYSVPQIHFLKDHQTLHNNLVVPEDVKMEENDDEDVDEIENSKNDSESTENGDNIEVASAPPERFNNNEGEKEYYGFKN